MIANLREDSRSNSDMSCILEIVENDMLVILDDYEFQGVAGNKPPDSLQVHQTNHRRRRSVGNIARDLG